MFSNPDPAYVLSPNPALLTTITFPSTGCEDVSEKV